MVVSDLAQYWPLLKKKNVECPCVHGYISVIYALSNMEYFIEIFSA
jgi:hypothetical protein